LTFIKKFGDFLLEARRRGCDLILGQSTATEIFFFVSTAIMIFVRTVNMVAVLIKSQKEHFYEDCDHEHSSNKDKK